MIDTAVQTAVFAALNTGALAGKVFDNWPQADDTFPRVIIGDDTITEWDTKAVNGGNVVARVHTFSRYLGKSETKELQGKIYDKLHRAELSATGWRFVSCDFIQSFSDVDQDGKTRHGVSEFRINIEQE